MQIIKRLKELLGYSHWCLLARKRFLAAISEHCHLENGTYYVVCGTREYLIKKGTPTDQLTSIGIPCNKGYVCVKVKSDTASKVFYAQIMMSTNEGYRYFNIKDKITIKYFNADSEAYTYQKAIQTFSPYWSTTSISNTKEYCIERIIPSKPRNQWNLHDVYRVFYDVFERYIVYLGSTPKESVNLSFSDIFYNEFPEYTLFIQKLLKHLPCVQKGVTYVFSHCDLHLGNVLVDNNNVYLIDFEEAKNEVFYYDLFNIIYVEYNDNNNSCLLNDYLSFDSRMIDCFDRAFKTAGVNFIPHNYKQYLMVFICIRLNNDIRIAKRKFNHDELANRVHSYILSFDRLIDYIINFSNNED